MRRLSSGVRLAAAVLAAALLLAACGGGGGHDMSKMGGGSDADASRTIDVAMTEFAFRPATFEVAKGTTVRFRFANHGKVMHEALIGDDKAQDDHEKDMASGDGHGMSDMPSMTKVRVGETGEATYTFDEAGTVLIGCHEPGHYAAGMKATVTVS